MLESPRPLERCSTTVRRLFFENPDWIVLGHRAANSAWSVVNRYRQRVLLTVIGNRCVGATCIAKATAREVRHASVAGKRIYRQCSLDSRRCFFVFGRYLCISIQDGRRRRIGSSISVADALNYSLNCETADGEAVDIRGFEMKFVTSLSPHSAHIVFQSIRLTKRGQQWQMLGSISRLTRFIFLPSLPAKLAPRNVYFNYCSKRRNFSNYCSGIVAPPCHSLFYGQTGHRVNRFCSKRCSSRFT